MKTTFKKLYLITVCSLLSLNAFADIAGNYNCTRTDANNTINSFPVSVTSTGGTYTFQWGNSGGDPAMYGTGVMSPTISNALSVIYWDPKNASVFGDELFTLNSDGSLTANWVQQGAKQTGTEVCKKSS